MYRATTKYQELGFLLIIKHALTAAHVIENAKFLIKLPKSVKNF